MKIRLGTRRSLLAWAQSSWVAREVERLNPGVTVELVGIDTRGDKIQDVPLQSVPGKEFFVAELDEALRSGAVEMSVHSMKDLSLDRPAAFVCAAVPPRENSRDVVLFRADVIDRLARGEKLRIGTSSPRQQVNLPPFLERALPRFGHDPVVELVDIRGNVNTRLARVHAPSGSERALDGVVLAFAGLIRLWRDQSGQEELRKLLQGVRWMVLPLRENPAAPAQGALAVECRMEDEKVRAILGRLHHEPSADRAAAERQLLADWGGGCHQRFGASAMSLGETELLFVRGFKPDGSFVHEVRWKAPRFDAKWKGARSWDGALHRRSIENLNTQLEANLARGGAVFVAHSRAAIDRVVSALRASRVWTSGTPSWFRLASQGIWVEGCAEGQGFAAASETVRQGVLQLPPLSRWSVLTHEAAVNDWNEAVPLATYRLEERTYPEETVAAITQAQLIFWSSGSQFDALSPYIKDAHAVHACGPGKTAARLRQAGIEPLIFPSVEEWREWIAKGV